MKRRTRNVIVAMLQGMTGAGLFRRLDYPGAPTEFVDSRSLEQALASGELGESLTSLLREYEEREIQRPYPRCRMMIPAMAALRSRFFRALYRVSASLGSHKSLQMNIGSNP